MNARDRATLRSSGFAQIAEGFNTTAEAFEFAPSPIEAGYGEDSLGPPSIIGDFVPVQIVREDSPARPDTTVHRA
jgi:hypothetical protein